jgi:SPP1 gp7 family putative phage head morphogenesis protein
MKPAEYWRRRSEEVAARQFAKADAYQAELAREYARATEEIRRAIEVFYQRYAENGEVSMAEARRQLSGRELRQFKMTLEEFIEKAKNNADGRWTKQLNEVYYRVRVSRYEALLTDIQQQIELLAGSRQKGTGKLLSDVYKDTYYRTIFELQKGTGFGVTFAKIDQNKLEIVLGTEFAGSNWSKRIWGDRDKLITELRTKLAQAFIRGESSDRTARDLAERMAVSRSNAERLVQTETAFFVGEATAAGYRASGVVNKYEILATLDNRTSEICRSMDGKVFALFEREVGVNYPPFHARCRTNVVPYFDDEIEVGERIARDEDGKVYFVSGDMTYQSWYNRYVAGTELPKKRKAEDSYLPVQLSFKDEKGLQWFIPLNSLITDVHVIAGEGVSVVLRASERLSQQYGGKPEEWSKKVGKIESEKYVFDIHWVEHPQFGSREHKIAGMKVRK